MYVEFNSKKSFLLDKLFWESNESEKHASIKYGGLK